ncbi:MAG: methylated-DNA--[protein]-cysteine S-methyltransferase [Bacteroidetes bacterium]|nr:methylated-DNA--[protein]-cysteine S-methyltransferase [Bacteroidota bacterium]
MAVIHLAVIPSPLGPLVAEATDEALLRLTFIDQPPSVPRKEDHPVLQRVATELEAYFAGTLTVFSVPVSPAGTGFEQTIWSLLSRIPYGTTLSYKELSVQYGNLKAIRAVGKANGSNPIAILIPCHRVIGADGSLTGYAGGLERKRWLLDFEAKTFPGTQLNLEL